MEEIIKHFASTVKEVSLFAKELTLPEIIRIALFVNLSVLPIIVAIKW